MVTRMQEVPNGRANLNLRWRHVTLAE